MSHCGVEIDCMDVGLIRYATEYLGKLILYLSILDLLAGLHRLGVPSYILLERRGNNEFCDWTCFVSCLTALGHKSHKILF